MGFGSAWGRWRTKMVSTVFVLLAGKGPVVPLLRHPQTKSYWSSHEVAVAHWSNEARAQTKKRWLFLNFEFSFVLGSLLTMKNENKLIKCCWRWESCQTAIAHDLSHFRVGNSTVRAFFRTRPQKYDIGIWTLNIVLKPAPQLWAQFEQSAPSNPILAEEVWSLAEGFQEHFFNQNVARKLFHLAAVQATSTRQASPQKGYEPYCCSLDEHTAVNLMTHSNFPATVSARRSCASTSQTPATKGPWVENLRTEAFCHFTCRPFNNIAPDEQWADFRSRTTVKGNNRVQSALPCTVVTTCSCRRRRCDSEFRFDQDVPSDVRENVKLSIAFVWWNMESARWCVVSSASFELIMPTGTLQVAERRDLQLHEIENCCPHVITRITLISNFASIVDARCKLLSEWAAVSGFASPATYKQSNHSDLFLATCGKEQILTKYCQGQITWLFMWADVAVQGNWFEDESTKKELK